MNKYTKRKDKNTMYRCRLEELRKEKGLTNKKWSEESGVSVDTISRIIHPENPEKDSPRINTLEDLCKPLGVELWEIFYLGDRSFVSLQSEIVTLKTEHDDLVAENAVLKERVEALREKNEALKDQIIDVLLKKSID
jgi:transcriptional regulator with XRE-family HTH domain